VIEKRQTDCGAHADGSHQQRSYHGSFGMGLRRRRGGVGEGITGQRVVEPIVAVVIVVGVIRGHFVAPCVGLRPPFGPLSPVGAATCGCPYTFPNFLGDARNLGIKHCAPRMGGGRRAPVPPARPGTAADPPRTRPYQRIAVSTLVVGHGRDKLLAGAGAPRSPRRSRPADRR
jgi:hypothetical protein